MSRRAVFLLVLVVIVAMVATIVQAENLVASCAMATSNCVRDCGKTTPMTNSCNDEGGVVSSTCICQASSCPTTCADMIEDFCYGSDNVGCGDIDDFGQTTTTGSCSCGSEKVSFVRTDTTCTVSNLKGCPRKGAGDRAVPSALVVLALAILITIALASPLSTN
jgi:hypothetical protein